MIIALDGVDGIGKSTVISLLRDYMTIDLKMDKVITVRAPGATALGQRLRTLVKDPEIATSPRAARLLFAADRLQFDVEFAEKNKDHIIISDRMNLVTDLVYAKADGIDLLDMDQMQRALSPEASWLKPDVYFVFQAPFEVSWERKQALNEIDKLKKNPEQCRIEMKGEAFLRKINDLYCSIGHTSTTVSDVVSAVLFNMISKRVHGSIVPVNADRPTKEILADIIQILDLPPRKM